MKRPRLRGWAALVAMVAMVLAGLMTVTAGSASAHTENTTATATCQSDGTYLVTFKLTYANGVPNGNVYYRYGTTTFQNGWSPSTWNDWTKLQTVTTANGTVQWTYTLPGNTTVAPWVYTYVKWSDNYITQGDNRPENLKGNCQAVKTKDATASVSVSQPTCDSAGTASVADLQNATLVGTLDQSVGAHTVTFKANNGHLFANGSDTLQVSYTIPGKDTSQNCWAKDAAASVTVTQPTCANRTATVTYTLVNATATPAVPDNSPGAHHSVSAANQGHLFPDGSTTTGLDYTVNAAPSDDDCAMYVVPVAPTVTQAECTGPGQSGGFSVTLADGPEGVSYSFNEETLVVTAVADSSSKFSSELGGGWVKVDNHHATYQVTRTSPGSCLVAVTPASPTHTTPSCATYNMTVTPSNQPGVVWNPSGSTVLAPGESVTYTDSAAEGYVLTEGAQTSWTFSNTLDVKSCTPPPVTTKTPIAAVGADCDGHGYVYFDNPTTGTAKFKVPFTKASGQHKKRFITVGAGSHGSLSLKHLKPHSVLKVRWHGETLDHAKVPTACTPPTILPPTGK